MVSERKHPSPGGRPPSRRRGASWRSCLLLVLLTPGIALAADSPKSAGAGGNMESAPDAGPGPASSPAAAVPSSEDATAADPASPDPDAEITVTAAAPVARARDALFQTLRAQGYRAGRRQGDTVVFRSYVPYHPDVKVHDDGWIEVKRARPRIHPPGKSFADEGSPLAWLWCALPVALPFCVSLSGVLISPARLHALKEDVYQDTHEEVLDLSNAVTATRMDRRLNVDIPAMLEALWAEEQVPAALRRAALLEWWDSRTETPEGEAARDAASAFMDAVVQTSDDPFTLTEINAYNARRSCARALLLDAPALNAGAQPGLPTTPSAPAPSGDPGYASP